MRSPDNSRYCPHYGMDTLKRVYADTGRRAALLPGGAAQSITLLMTWVLSSGHRYLHNS